ncbi:DUF2254 domain-containing protein [Geodermatophilus sp. URMC 65]
MTSRPRGGRLQAVWGAATGALWPLPAAALVAAVGLGIGLTELDQALAFGQDPIQFVFTGGPSAARTLLSAIASSLISATTLLFSLTIVTLQLASSQYSPRLLQTFVRDRVVQVCLGTLLGTFVYALVVLRTVRSADEAQGSSFVPRLSVTVAFVLTLASVAALVTFLSHQTRQLRVETMMRDVHSESARTRARLQERQEGRQPDRPLPEVPDTARPLCARSSGFLVQVFEGPLLEAVTGSGAVLLLDRRPGDPVVTGTPMAWAWPQGAGDAVPVEELEEALQRAVDLGHERTDVVDPSYGLRKLVDIAARALSPGINDPTTAGHALSHVSALLGDAAVRDTWHRRLTDEDGAERLLLRSWTFSELLDLGVTQVRYYGREDLTVVDRLFALLAEVAWRARTPLQQEALRRERDALVEQSRSSPPAGRTPEDVQRWARTVDEALAGKWLRPAG